MQHADAKENEGRPWRPFSVPGALMAGLLMTLLGCASSSVAQEPERRAAGRLMPPELLTCDRNQLTSWFGKVSGYRRSASETWLEISTDYDTVEQATLKHGDAADASARYLLWGEPFTAQDWSRIERAPGVLIDGMRAVVWVCEDGKTPPVVDWQPPRE